jgi:hypothetical protein
VFTDDATATTSRALHEGTLESIRDHFGVVVSSEDVLKVWRRF